MNQLTITDKRIQKYNFGAPPAWPSVGLSLSVGGARGLAHVGVLQSLEEAGIQPIAISGASMGGIIGALYACGMSAGELRHFALSLAKPREMLRLVDLLPGRRGLISSDKLRRLLCHEIGQDTTFADLRVPLALSATDLALGRQVKLTEGRVLPAVMATCAFPGVFPPVEIDGRQLVDGGVLNNLPVDMLAAFQPQLLIAVDVSPQVYEGSSYAHPPILNWMPGPAQILYQSTMLMNHALTDAHLEDQPPDLLIKPPIPGEIGVFDGFTRAKEIIDYGRGETRNRLPQLLPKIGQYPGFE